MASFNINVAGFCIAGIFGLVWAVTLAYWRWGDVEHRWTAKVSTQPGAAPRDTAKS